MAGTKKRTRAKSDEARVRKLPFHAFWSGSLSFGLVNVPVLVFPATRHSGVHLRLLSPEARSLSAAFIVRKTVKRSQPMISRAASSSTMVLT